MLIDTESYHTPLDEIDHLIPAAVAHQDDKLGRLWKTGTAATAAAKRRHLNGLAEAGAVLLINGHLYYHRARTAAWALSKTV